jgi:tRNA threonylcarbamoyl adenosine modification protein YeaZ
VLLLAFDTATPAVTVALHDGSRVIAQEWAVDARRHGELLAPTIDKVLRSAGVVLAGLTDLAVGTGPGPYTGLRAGLVTANVLASTLHIPVDGICTLDAIAASVAAASDGQRRDFLVATDARRRELYWALYEGNGTRLSGPQVGRPAELPAGYPVAGTGPELYPDVFDEPLEPRYPSAAGLAELAVARRTAGKEPGRPEPLYLRRPDAREPGPPKRVTEPAPARRARS